MLWDFIKSRMEAHPDSTLEDERVKISYRELLHKAEAFSKKLDFPKVGILCESELGTATAILACFAAGVTAVPLSHRYGSKHCGNIKEAIGLSHFITGDGNELMVRQGAPVISESEDLSDVAVIMCTSGTTGAPKGAMITENNLLCNLRDIETYFAIGETDRILIARPLYHCAVLTGEFFISLIRGLHITFYNGGFNPIEVLRQIRLHEITVLCGTPTLFHHMCHMAKRKNAASLPIRTVAVSGECLSLPVADELCAVLSKANIYSVYGLTEASPRVSYLPPAYFREHPTSVGYPLASIEAQIIEGELRIRGDSIMKGYYNNANATQKTIVDGWLHTGDMAEMDSSGLITIKGRMDHMIIRAGMNIYPQEIENALKRDSRVKEAVVRGVSDGKVGQRIQCDVVVHERDMSIRDLFTLCKENLPSFQVPDTIEIVDTIPISASGKVIRQKVGC